MPPSIGPPVLAAPRPLHLSSPSTCSVIEGPPGGERPRDAPIDATRSGSLHPVRLAENGHGVYDGTLHSVRDLDIAGAAAGQDRVRLRAMELLEERIADRHRPLVVLRAHAVGPGN